MSKLFVLVQRRNSAGLWSCSIVVFCMLVYHVAYWKQSTMFTRLHWCLAESTDYLKISHLYRAYVWNDFPLWIGEKSDLTPSFHLTLRKQLRRYGYFCYMCKCRFLFFLQTFLKTLRFNVIYELQSNFVGRMFRLKSACTSLNYCCFFNSSSHNLNIFARA